MNPHALQQHKGQVACDEVKLISRIIELAIKYGRYGYWRMTALLHQDGWLMNHKRVERISRR